jgi:hypothetical protein
MSAAMKSFLILVSLACACADRPDDRPLTLEYMTETILAPNCGTANCHSTWKHQQDNVFDTVSGAEHTLQKQIFNMGTYPLSLLSCYSVDGSAVFDPCIDPDEDRDARSTYLYLVLTDRDIDGGDRMPLDQALPNRDIEYIEDWINAGAPGYTSIAGSFQ